MIEGLTEQVDCSARRPLLTTRTANSRKHLLVEKDDLFTFLADPAVSTISWRAEHAVWFRNVAAYACTCLLHPLMLRCTVSI